MKDLVCNMELNEKTDKKFSYKGKDYFFCSLECQSTFKNNPEKFIKFK